ncbi:MAG: hypothetical protein TE42_08740, partial [Candidatus Synechococcus spongiarum SP3]
QAILLQQGKVVSWDGSQVVVQVSQTWLGMAEARRTLLEQAIAATLGKDAHLVLTGAESREAGRGQRPVSPPELPPKPSRRVVQPSDQDPVKPSQIGPQAKPQPRPLEPHHNRREPSPSASSGTPPDASGASLDAVARNLANFFNGEVVDSNNDIP